MRRSLVVAALASAAVLVALGLTPTGRRAPATRPLVIADEPSAIGGEPVLLAAPTHAPAGARERWYEEVGARADVVDQACGWGGMDVACEGDVCVLRAREPWDAANAVRSYWRQPHKVLERILVELEVLAPEDVACVGAVAPLVGASFEIPTGGAGIPGETPGARACLVQQRAHGPDAPSEATRETGIRLCALLDARAVASR